MNPKALNMSEIWLKDLHRIERPNFHDQLKGKYKKYKSTVTSTSVPGPADLWLKQLWAPSKLIGVTEDVSGVRSYNIIACFGVCHYTVLGAWT